MPAPLRRLVLDILKPIKGPSVIDVGRELGDVRG
ncbi:MAG: hypothetical protein GSR86_06820, partial [Desulfurococcales archaeon]|nr:hypothetical protein [Desulfurococcales archaeon]